MSEKQIPRLEQQQPHEKAINHEHVEQAEKQRHEQAEKARQEKSTENLARIQEMAKAEAETAQKIAADETSSSEDDSLLGVQHSLKSTAYAKTLARIQQKLPKPARTFSRLTHNPVIDKVSSLSEHTVARPSGILGGSICAFLGSLALLYYSKHYGFRYNYLLLFILFAGGYALGAALELIVWLVYGRKQRY